jgi:hypothetical protein
MFARLLLSQTFWGGGDYDNLPHDFCEAALVHQLGGFGGIKPPCLPLPLLRPIIELVVHPHKEHPHLAKQSILG